MAAHIVLLLLLFCEGERNCLSVAVGFSKEDQDLQVTLSETQQVLAQPERPLPNVKPNDSAVTLQHPESAAMSLIPKHSAELPVNHEKKSTLTNGEVEGVINDRSPMPTSEEERSLRPELHLETGVGDVVPNRTQGLSKWVTESKDGQSGPRSRRRRSWLWNQFFVIEEYRGPEPVLIGRLHTDMDKGDGRTKYMLEGEGVGSVFVIDSNTGNIHVTKSLDREEKDQYRLIATATDRQTGRALEPSSEFIIRVQDINDNPPVFPNEAYIAMVPEMANIGTSIIQVTARDADDPTYGNSARLVYAITHGQDYFSVDPQTGLVTASYVQPLIPSKLFTAACLCSR